ncbi:hypothetical protein HDV62DRAFT_137483 [Trichoderma sp. SZMC 28011]
MADENNDSGFVCVDTASSITEGRLTPSPIMPKANKETRPSHWAKKNGINEYTQIHTSSSLRQPLKEMPLPLTIGTHARHIEHQPIPGREFILRTRQEPRRFLGIEKGKPKLFGIPVGGREIFWHCVKDGNWYGLWNPTCGTYLGHDGAGRMVVTSTHHKTAQYFIPVRQENGGYILHTFHPETKELSQVGEDDTRHLLIERRKGGLAFDFIEAKYVRYSVTLALPNMKEENLGSAV